MKHPLSLSLDIFNKILLLALVGLMPLFFLPWSLDVLETNKQALLLIVASLLVVSVVGRILREREISLMRGWQNALPLFVFLAVFVSSVFSIGRGLSWFGGSSQEYVSFFTVAALTVLFYAITHLLKGEKMERIFFAVSVFSGSLVLALSLCNIFGASLFPWSFLQVGSFNTIGTINALGVYAIFVSILGQSLWLVSGREEREVLLSGKLGWFEKALILFTTLASVLLLLAIDFWALWVLALVGEGVLFLFGVLRANEFARTEKFILPMLTVVIAIFFLFLPRPFDLGLPVEVTPTVSASWNIAKDSLSDQSLLFGSGPGTYIFDYAKFRELDVNQTAFWDVRFDRGHSYFLTLLATGGIVSVSCFVLMLLAILIGGLNVLLKDKNHATWKMHFVMMSSWLVVATSGFLYSWNMTLQFLFYVLSAILVSQFLRDERVHLKHSPRLGLSLSFVFVVFSIGVLTILFITVQRQMAESAFAKAVRLDRSMVSIDEVVSHLDKAATLNKYNDVYYRNLAQALLYKLDEVVAEDADGQTETDNTQLIQVLTSSSINAAKRATDVSPYNVLNWRVRGSVYRELMAFVSGADQFAKLSFERATQLEPNNPVGFVGLGRTHLATAALASKSLNSQDDSVRTQARQVINSELASAEEALRTAISLKSDYAQSHFYLALVFEEQGRLDEAFAKLDAVRQYNPLDVGVAFQMGQLAMRMEKYDRARLEFEHAIKLSPEFANARWFLASVYEIDGDADAAIEQIGEILKLQPNNEVARARLERLEEGKIKLSLPEPLSDGESVEIKQ